MRVIQGPGFAALMYHEVSLAPSAGQHHLTPLYDISQAMFESQVRQIVELGFETVLPEELAGSGSAGKVVLTFDDGLAGNFHYALPVLRKYGCRAAFFVVAGFVGRPQYMSWSELRQLRDSGMSVQSHGMTHRPLENLEEAEVRKELFESKRILEQELGTRVTSLSAPHGSYNASVVTCARELGYRTIFTSDIRHNNAESLPMPAVLGRIAVTRKLSSRQFERILKCDRAEFARQRAVKAAKNGLKRAIGIENYRRLYRRYFNIAAPKAAE